MQRARHRIPGWLGLAGAVGALILVPTLSGCPGTLDPDVAKMASNGSGGSSATGGSNGTGGATGGATGTGGTVASNCTGGNDGATLITNSCATPYCHDSTSMIAGLDLTIDANIGARLVGVLSQGTTANDSVCENWPKPYLEPNMNPAAGLLIDKITMSSGPALCPSGSSMPFGLGLLSTSKQACIEQWAEGLVMAAP
jgi:hypothetical protein